MVTKDEYTKVFLEETHQDAATAPQRKIEWWLNIRDDGGLRLTELGSSYLTVEVDLASYQVQIPRDVRLTARNILVLDNWIRCPYYLNLKKHLIVLYGEHQASELKLYGEDLHVFFENYALEG